MFGLVGAENPVVIDSLWRRFPDAGRDIAEEDTCKMKIDIDTRYLTDGEVSGLINDLESLSYRRDSLGDIIFGFKNHFTVNYELPENGEDDPIVKIELRGARVPESVYDKVVDCISDYGADCEERSF